MLNFDSDNDAKANASAMCEHTLRLSETVSGFIVSAVGCPAGLPAQS